MVEALATQLLSLDLPERLAAFRKSVAGKIVFTTSLGLEDQVLTHVIASHVIAMQKLDIEIVTLDTGRLFPETHTLWADTEARYGIKIRGFLPEAQALEALLETQGTNGFYASIDNRKACCNIRKVVPLGRALNGAAGWITGLRADQSSNRNDAEILSKDAARALLKFNPLIDWSRDKALAFAKANHVPLNPLHNQGFASIGCAPCTRAIQPGQPERAGRWWWEDEAATGQECGLHIGPDGRLTRTKNTLETNS